MSLDEARSTNTVETREKLAYERGLRDGRREGEGAIKSDAKHKRKVARLADELANHIVRNGSLRHEVDKLEDLLAWIHRTGQPLDEIREVIERTIPRRLARTSAPGTGASESEVVSRGDA